MVFFPENQTQIKRPATENLTGASQNHHESHEKPGKTETVTDQKRPSRRGHSMQCGFLHGTLDQEEDINGKPVKSKQNVECSEQQWTKAGFPAFNKGTVMIQDVHDGGRGTRDMRGTLCAVSAILL